MCFVSNRIWEVVALGASLFWDVTQSKTKKQAGRGFLHSLSFFLRQNFDIHKEENGRVLGGVKPGDGDRKQVWHNVLYRF